MINGTDACAILSQSVNEAGYGLFIVIEKKTKIYRELTTTGSVYQTDGVICGVRLPNNERRFLQQSGCPYLDDNVQKIGAIVNKKYTVKPISGAVFPEPMCTADFDRRNASRHGRSPAQRAQSRFIRV